MCSLFLPKWICAVNHCNSWLYYLYISDVWTLLWVTVCISSIQINVKVKLNMWAKAAPDCPLTLSCSLVSPSTGDHQNHSRVKEATDENVFYSNKWKHFQISVHQGIWKSTSCNLKGIIIEVKHKDVKCASL